MNYKLVIFDCDGVLVDSEAIGNRFISEALTLAGIPISAEGALSKFLGGKLTQIKEDAEKQLGFHFLLIGWTKFIKNNFQNSEKT